MNFLIITCCLAILIHRYYDRIAQRLFHENIPWDLKEDNQLINSGIIPRRLTWVIPVDYELREDYHMSSRIEPTFIDGVKRPKWCLVIKLQDSIATSESKILYELDGSICES